MKKPIDLKAQLEALKAQEALLKERHRQQLVDLLERTGADLLDPDLLAGLLLDAVDRTAAANGHDDGTLQRWRAEGEAFFRKGSKRARGGAADAPPAATAGPPEAADRA